MGSSVSVSFATRWFLALIALGLFTQGCVYDSYMYDNEEDIYLLSTEDGGDGVGPVAVSPEDTSGNKAKLDSAEVYRETAARFRDLGDRDNAIANYRKALELYPDHHRACFELAEMLALDEKTADEALTLLKDLLRKMRDRGDEEDEDGIRQRAETLLFSLDEKGMALTEAAAVLVAYGVRAEEAERLKNALDLYCEALKLWPACSEARLRARDLCRRQGWDMPGAVAHEAPREVFLSLTELTPAAATVGNGKLLVNKTKWDMPFFNRGTVLTEGIWAPAPSVLTFELDGRYSRLTAKVLISAFAGSEQQVAALEKELGKPRCGTVNFKVLGDGNLLYESGLISYGVDPRDVDVDVSSVKKLTLECDPGDGSDLLDFSVWADGRLYLK